MNTSECLRWLKKETSQHGPVERPTITLDLLFETERSSEERLSWYLCGLAADMLPKRGQQFLVAVRPPEYPVERYLAWRRIAFSADQMMAVASPYSPFRIHDWMRPNHLWWLFVTSWLMVGRKQWQELETVSSARDFFSE